MVLNNVTKFHKILIKNIRDRERTSFKKFHKILIKNIRDRERTSFKMVNFHKQRAITTESMVQYGPL